MYVIQPHKTNLVASGNPENMAVNVLYDMLANIMMTYTFINFCDAGDKKVSNNRSLWSISWRQLHSHLMSDQRDQFK